MRIIRYITVLSAAVLLLTGCITDNRFACDEPRTEPGAIRVKLTVSAGVAPKSRAAIQENGYGAENGLKDIIIMIFGYSTNGTGALEVCERFVLASLPVEQTKWENESTLLIENVTQLTQPKNVYVIANWTGFVQSNYVAGTTVENILLAELSSISAPIPTPTAIMPMVVSGGITNYVFSDNAYKATVGMVRQSAKIRLRVDFDAAFTTFYGSRLVLGGTAGDVKIRAVNVTNSSFVVRKTPAAAPSGAGIIHYPFTRPMKPHTIPSIFLADSCYVFERPLYGNSAANKKGATSLLLQVPFILDGVVTPNNYYRIYIDNSADNVPEAAANPYTVLRNYIYDIKTTVKGFGLPEELAVPDALQSEMTILDWGVIKFDTDLQSDDTGGGIDGKIDPWDPNGKDTGDNDIGTDDPDDEIDDTGSGGTIDPWDPNQSGTDL